MVLLHLLRFTPDLPRFRLIAAHLDHAMRGGSAGDADWVRGLCRAWDVPCRTRRLPRAPEGEGGARAVRYAFLDEVREAEGAALVLTAHHADDQAETVLFRAARGSGVRGLRGILPRRDPAIWRPLLEATRSELAAYARSRGLGWRSDPTNRLPFARNVLRHEILPRLEESVASGAREALAGLARRARENEAAWESLLPDLLRPLGVRAEGTGVSFLRAPLAALHPAVGARLLRALAAGVGISLDAAGTRSAVTFSRAGASGTGVDLTGGARLGRALDRLTLAPGPEPAAPDRDTTLEIGDAEAGSGEVRLAGRRWRIAWGPKPLGGTSAAFLRDGLRFPLEVRGWAAGDRIRFAYGHKKLKKVFLESRVPSGERHARPVVVDAGRDVLWIPGIARSTLARGADPESLLHIGCTDADTD